MRAFQAYKNLSNTKIAVIGDHPDGFDTCSYDSKKLREISGAKVERIELSDLFDEAKKIDAKQNCLHKTKSSITCSIFKLEAQNF